MMEDREEEQERRLNGSSKMFGSVEDKLGQNFCQIGESRFFSS